HWIPPAAHIDLRFVLRRLGYSGGLKRIEQELRLGEREGVEGLRGLDAVRLWQEWRRGRRESLDLLIEYNRADTVNLEPLLEFSVAEMARRLRPARPDPPVESYGTGIIPHRPGPTPGDPVA
ncbi:MAG: ribonuclease H-like domain-containing protein, partial [Thermoplasmata archaeon]